MTTKKRGRLVVGRLNGESVVLMLPNGDWLEVGVEIEHGRTRLRMDAPRDIAIVRKELLDEAQVRQLGPEFNRQWPNLRRGGAIAG